MSATPDNTTAAYATTGAQEPELTDDDIRDAVAHIPGYLDISFEDFRLIYHLAWRHAIARLLALPEAK